MYLITALDKVKPGAFREVAAGLVIAERPSMDHTVRLLDVLVFTQSAIMRLTLLWGDASAAL